MMKKWIRLGFVLMLCLCVAAGAAAETCIGKTDSGRLNLRAAPHSNAKVVGRYYTGVPVTVMETKDSWSRISIEGREGWVKTRYLSETTEVTWGAPARSHDWSLGQQDGGVISPSVLVYSSPDIMQTPTLTFTDTFRVMGLLDDTWAHVAAVRDDSTVVSGYVESWRICRADDNEWVIDGGSKGGKVALYRSSKTSSSKVITLYSGAPVVRMFDYYTDKKGWMLVSCWDTPGYVQTKFLRKAPGRWAAPAGTLKGETASRWQMNKEDASFGEMTAEEAFVILGRSGSRYLIQLNAEDAAQLRYGYLDKTDIKTIPSRSTKAK